MNSNKHGDNRFQGSSQHGGPKGQWSGNTRRPQGHGQGHGNGADQREWRPRKVDRNFVKTFRVAFTGEVTEVDRAGNGTVRLMAKEDAGKIGGSGALVKANELLTFERNDRAPLESKVGLDDNFGRMQISYRQGDKNPMWKPAEKPLTLVEGNEYVFQVQVYDYQDGTWDLVLMGYISKAHYEEQLKVFKETRDADFAKMGEAERLENTQFRFVLKEDGENGREHKITRLLGQLLEKAHEIEENGTYNVLTRLKAGEGTWEKLQADGDTGREIFVACDKPNVDLLFAIEAERVAALEARRAQKKAASAASKDKETPAGTTGLSGVLERAVQQSDGSGNAADRTGSFYQPKRRKPQPTSAEAVVELNADGVPSAGGNPFAALDAVKVVVPTLEDGGADAGETAVAPAPDSAGDGNNQ